MDRESTEAVIRCQFVLGLGFPSRLIAWYSAGVFSHCDAVLSDGSLLGARSDTIGDIDPGVRIRPPFYEQWGRRITFTLPANDAAEAAWLAFLRAQLGKAYDHTAIWGFATGRDWRAPDSWFCAELLCAALEQAKVLPVLYTPTNKMTPAGLATVLSAVGAIAS